MTRHVTPMIARITIGVLLVLMAGVLAIYVLTPGRSSGDDARTAAAIAAMDKAQGEADARREDQRSAAALL